MKKLMLAVLVIFAVLASPQVTKAERLNVIGKKHTKIAITPETHPSGYYCHTPVAGEPHNPNITAMSNCVGCTGNQACYSE